MLIFCVEAERKFYFQEQGLPSTITTGFRCSWAILAACGLKTVSLILDGYCNVASSRKPHWYIKQLWGVWMCTWIKFLNFKNIKKWVIPNESHNTASYTYNQLRTGIKRKLILITASSFDLLMTESRSFTNGNNFMGSFNLSLNTQL